MKKRILILFLIILAATFAWLPRFATTAPEGNAEGDLEQVPHQPGTAFRFIGGNKDAGKDAFERLNCIQCHLVKGTELAEPKGKRRLQLELGAEQRFVRRYEDILLAVTNPRHVVTQQYRDLLTKAQAAGEIEPFMPDLTNDMSARQLIDIAAFLDANYQKAGIGYAVPGR